MKKYVDDPVLTLLVVLRLEVLSEDARHALPESGHESAAEFAQHLVGRIVRLAVDD